jgi:hypothetical protein
MLLSRYSTTRSARLIIWLLLPALMLAQWLGYEHRIEHANWEDNFQLQSAPGYGKTIFSSDKHSCSALDAATLGACLSSTAPLVQLQNYTCIAIVEQFQSWLSLPKLHFSSRAPPLL